MQTTLKLMTRREFLRMGVGVAAVAGTLPSFLTRTGLVMAADNPSLIGTGKDDPILVVIQLSGGNDGLNTIVPFGHDRYYSSRPSLAIPADKTLKINDELGFHPALTGLKEIYDSGKLAVVQGIGYPNPDRSHFRSLEIWHSAVSDDFETSGWIGRTFDHTCNNAHLNEREKISPTLAVSIGETLNPALQGLSPVGIALRDPEQFFRMTQLYSKSSVGKKEKSTSSEVGSAMDFLRRTALNAEKSADNIRKSVRSVQSQTEYPKDPFAQGLKLVSSMIAGHMDTRIYYVTLSGFDTHANQAGAHERLLKTLSDGIAAFQKDLQALGQADRVTTFTFSEFGRRVSENGSRGTDHGQAAPLFVFGNRVKGGIVGEHPSFEKLNGGDLVFQTDFRRIYATLLDRWLKVDSKAVLGQGFEHLPVLS